MSHLLDTIGPIEQLDAPISQSQFMAVVNHQIKYVQQIQDILLQGSARLNQQEGQGGPGQHHHPQQQQMTGQQLHQQSQPMQQTPHSMPSSG